ncbi:HAD-like domain-containing protein [Ochromonadaceae sp. CCMP2298]|nr:HAD-like domain-containing protein [Ochromonadaceae sp. CCMP2298]
MGVSGSGGDGIEEEEEEEGVEEVPAEEAEELEADVEDTEEGAEGEEEGELEEFNPYQFISQLPPHSDVCILDKICLPPLSPGQSRTPLPTLALDLDETLVHCTVEPIPKPDLIFPVSFNGQVYQVYVRKRPYLDYFLETVSKSFEVVVFTASQKVYADTLLDKLDPTRKLVKHRLFREACLLVQGNYLKDLHVLGRDLRTTLLVDNSPHAYSYHNDNGVPIESWYDDDSDTELLKLIGFLKTLQGVDDVRPIGAQ